jgi:succinate dehydrogenase / fumarate reductase flavoprotein subunit
MKHTLVIVGAGLAGLSAALTAVKNGWTVKLVSSLASERAQSVMAEGGINAALNTKGEEDSPEQHYADTLTAACGLADPNAVWGMTQAAPELVHSLHRLGVQFNVTDDDELDLRNFGGQKKKRTAFAQSDTGKQLMTALIDAVRREESAGTVERFPHHKFRTLLFSGNICGGCTVQDTYTGELLRFVCDAVLIATGGPHGLFGDTTGSLANTGEVTAELFRLGVPMANLEMIQYHPTTVEQGGKRMLLSEAARGEGGRLLALRNGKPWYFMEEKYPELGNLMPRDITAREVWTVSRDYEVFLDMTELPKEVMEHKLAGLVDDCQTYLHKDIRKEPIPILPGIHYFMGGIQPFSSG